MKKLEFPLLQPNQIEVRVGQVGEKGFSLLLYKTARTDAEILDQVVGQGNWQKKFYTLNGVGIGDSVRSIVVCSVGIYDEDRKEWVWKDDSGTEGDIEQDKSVCSDAFKRAAGGSCWGIGRELYYTGFIFVKGGTHKETLKNGGEKWVLDDKYEKLFVKEIEWSKDTKLKKLVIVNQNKDVRYSYGSSEKVAQTSENQPKKAVSTFNKDFLNTKVGSLTPEQLEKLGNYFDSASSSLQAKFMFRMNELYKVVAIEDLSELQAYEMLEKIYGGN